MKATWVKEIVKTSTVKDHVFRKERKEDLRGHKPEVLDPVGNHIMLVNRNFQGYLCQTTRFVGRSTLEFVIRLVLSALDAIRKDIMQVNARFRNQ